jgi:hypothetical protein
VWQDLNLRPLASKASTLTSLSYTQLGERVSAAVVVAGSAGERSRFKPYSCNLS